MTRPEPRCEQPSYETSRLAFEPIGSDHAAALFPALSDPLIYEHLGCDPPPSVEWLCSQFARVAAGPPPHRPDEQWLNFGVRLKADGQWIGRVEATARPQWAEVAYLFGSVHWGRGYAAESLAWLQHYLRIAHGISEFWATTAPANDRSIRLLLRSGYAPAALSTIARSARTTLAIRFSGWSYLHRARRMPTGRPGLEWRGF